MPATEQIYKGTTQKGWKSTDKKSSTTKFGIWAKFVEVIRTGIGYHQRKTDELEFQFDAMKSESFDPSTEYLSKAMKAKGVQRFLEMTVAEPLYMVIGIKIVEGANIKYKTSGEKGGGAALGGDGIIAGVPLGLTLESDHSRKFKEIVSFESPDAQVIGFRIKKINVAECELEEDYTTDGAYFKDGSKGGGDQAEFLASELDENDATGDVVSDLQTTEVIDEESGEECYCVYQTAVLE